MSLTLKETLQRAAERFEEDAELLRDFHTIAPDHKDWTGEPEAKAAHDECRELAAECRRHAGIDYAEIECPDFESTSEHLITPELQAALEGRKP